MSSYAASWSKSWWHLERYRPRQASHTAERQSMSVMGHRKVTSPAHSCLLAAYQIAQQIALFLYSTKIRLPTITCFLFVLVWTIFFFLLVQTFNPVPYTCSVHALMCHPGLKLWDQQFLAILSLETYQGYVGGGIISGKTVCFSGPHTRQIHTVRRHPARPPNTLKKVFLERERHVVVARHIFEKMCNSHHSFHLLSG